jgi:hypothetical protein
MKRTILARVIGIAIVAAIVGAFAIAVTGGPNPSASEPDAPGSEQQSGGIQRAVFLDLGMT